MYVDADALERLWLMPVCEAVAARGSAGRRPVVVCSGAGGVVSETLRLDVGVSLLP